ncbi:MAG TPA: glycosyl hydrolase family 28-related protein [Pirellulales bacterium]
MRRPIREFIAKHSARTRAILLAACLAATAQLAAAEQTFNVKDFGAVGDGVAKDTAAFQKALDACAVAGGGEVLVPAGKFLIGSVQVGDRTLLKLEADSVITGSGDINDYPMLDIRWEGRWQPGHRALIYTANVEHTGIVGPGRIEGNSAVAAGQNPRGAVVLEPISCTDVRWEGFTVTQGGNWATHPTYCTNVVIKNVNIRSGRDGIDVDSCHKVRIENCEIDTGDDSISLKSGRGLNGARLHKPTEDVVITGCKLHGRTFACIGIGSETSGGILNVKIEHCSLSARTFAVYVKTRIGRGGAIENISGDNLDILSGGFLRVNLISSGNTNTADDPVPGPLGYPTGKNFQFTNIRLKDAAEVAEVTQIDADHPLVGFTLKNITGTAAKGISLQHIRDATLADIQVTGTSGALVAVHDVTGIGLDGSKEGEFKSPAARQPGARPAAGSAKAADQTGSK